MQEIFVLDTSVLLHDPRAPLSFPGATVVIPAAVVEELDGKKHNTGELGMKARAAARLLDQLRGSGRLADGVPAPGGSTIRVELNHRAAADLQRLFTEDSADNRILAVAHNLQQECEATVTLVSRDVILRIKADALGLPVTDWAELPAASAPESSHVELQVERSMIDQLYRERQISLPGLALAVNQFALLRDQAGGSASALARCTAPGVLRRAQVEAAA